MLFYQFPKGELHGRGGGIMLLIEVEIEIQEFHNALD